MKSFLAVGGEESRETIEVTCWEKFQFLIIFIILDKKSRLLVEIPLKMAKYIAYNGKKYYHHKICTYFCNFDEKSDCSIHGKYCKRISLCVNIFFCRSNSDENWIFKNNNGYSVFPPKLNFIIEITPRCLQYFTTSELFWIDPRKSNTIKPIYLFILYGTRLNGTRKNLGIIKLIVCLFCKIMHVRKLQSQIDHHRRISMYIFNLF